MYDTKSLELLLIITIPMLLIIENVKKYFVEKYFVNRGDAQIYI